MNEDTIRTRALNTAREHWKPILSLIAAVGTATLTAAVTYGRVTEHYANVEKNYGADATRFQQQLDRIEHKVDSLMSLPDRVQELKKFKDDMEDNWRTAYEHAGDRIPRKRK